MIDKIMKDYIDDSGFNYVRVGEAFEEGAEGLRMFDGYLIGCAAAEDPIFSRYRSNLNIMRGRFVHPLDWLPEAKTVMSVFFPFSEKVKASNMKDMTDPSSEWRHARYVGQKHLNNMTVYLRDKIIDSGFKCVAPAFDERYIESYVKRRKVNSDYGGNWSERHAAYAAGLGTFGLSKGLITKRGVAGRFISLITDMGVEPIPREYSGIYDYCSMCGQCIKNCPAEAISFEKGKLHVPCDKYLTRVRGKYDFRPGCGKCQVGVPCMDKAPT